MAYVHCPRCRRSMDRPCDDSACEFTHADAYRNGHDEGYEGRPFSPPVEGHDAWVEGYEAGARQADIDLEYERELEREQELEDEDAEPE